MNNIAIFAHYDKDNLIDDYVVYYLEQLKKYVKILFLFRIVISAENKYLK